MEPTTNTTLKTIGNYCFAIGETIVRSIADSFIIFFESLGNSDSRIYKAEFGEKSEILSSSNTGFCVNGTECLTLEESYRNCFVQSNTGGGKSTTIIIPSLIKMEGATFVTHDPSGELCQKTSGFFHSKGYKIVIINFSRPETSDSYNPLDYITAQADINKVATLLVTAALPSQHADPFWNLQATNTLRIFISIILTQEKQYRNLANVKYLLSVFSAEPQKVDKIFAKYASDTLLADYKGLIAMDNKLLTSIISTANAALQLFNDEDVCKATSISTVDFAKLRSEKTVIYIQNSTTDAKYYSSLISVFFEQLMKSLLVRLPEKGKDLDVFLMLDEAATLKLPSLKTFLTNCRKYACGCLTSWQSQEQIINAYGPADAETIKNNSLCKIYLTGQGLKTSEELEKTLGRTEITDENGKTQVKPLLLSEEIRMMDIKEALIISGSRKPYKVRLTPYYQNPFLKLKTNMKPVLCLNDLVSKQVSLIPLV